METYFKTPSYHSLESERTEKRIWHKIKCNPGKQNFVEKKLNIK